MIVLHGTWIPADAPGTVGSFLFWGERAGGDGHQRRRRRREIKPDRRPHPFATPVVELQAALGSLGPEVAGRLAEARPSTAIMQLPAEGDRPLISFLHRSRRSDDSPPDEPPAAVAATNGHADPAENGATEPVEVGPSAPAAEVAVAAALDDEDEDDELRLAAFSLPVLALAGADALAVLAQLPDDTLDGRLTLPKDILFWRLAATFGLDLLARQRFVPAFTISARGDGRTGWQPLFDLDEDRARLDRLAQGLPPVCRAVANAHGRPLPPVDDPRRLVLDFLQTGMEGLARGWLEQWQMRGSQFQRPRLATASERWASALRAGAASIGATAFEAQTIGEGITAWTAPLVRPTQPGGFRTFFQLEEPPGPRGEGAATMTAPDPQARIWRLNFLLQSRDDPDVQAPAAAVWAEAGTTLRFGGQRFEHAQERLLADLGRAARLFPPLEGGLWDARPAGVDLTTGEAYTFLKEAAPLLIESGFGVTTPSWWDRRSPRLPLGMSLRLRGRGQTAASAGLATGVAGLDAIVEYEWQLALGDQELDREDFKRLVEQAVPLVQVRGYWIELRPDQVAIAQKALQTPEKGIMPLRTALRLALGAEEDEQVLPVLKVIGEGWLSQLVGGDDEPAEVSTPAGFHGTLRPYQQRGLTWLSFLSDVGLGALLADDMGLGKCLVGETLLFTNGTLRRADRLWAEHAGTPWFDGEGWWAEPTSPLLVNAIDQASGRLRLRPIRRLYRQQVRETLKRVTLEDGNSITITGRHKLLTSHGWTNDFRVGDYACVPARLVWDGQPVDRDLITILAWQIAEGYELSDRATVSITQKDPAVLRDVRLALVRLSERQQVVINQPTIRPDRRGLSVLTVSSRAYRQFLEVRGYAWGRRSADKTVPDFIMQADDDSVRLFLRHYFDAEASVVASLRSVEISSASTLLMQQLATLLRRFGIWLRVSVKHKRAANGSGIVQPYAIGVLGGNSARRFLSEVGFGIAHKQQKLEQICASDSNTNVEGIPAASLVAATVARTQLPLRHFGMHNTVYMNGTQQFSRASLTRVISSIDDILSGAAEQHYRQAPAARWTAQTLAAYADLDVAALDDTRRQVTRLLDQEVFYCRIAAIEPVDHDGWVYDFEVEEHHNFVANGILCHNTIQMIALLLRNKATATDRPPVLLICPTSVVGNWRRECERFAPSLKVLVHHGGGRATAEQFAREAARHDLVISTYGLAYRDEETLAGVLWDGVVLDEAQNVKNPATRQAQAVRALKARYRVALTGTPVENRLGDLWSIMEFLNPGYLGTADAFKARFAIPIERWRDTLALARLRRLVAPFLLRRLKTDPTIIADLPEKMEMKVYYQLTREQGRLYEDVVKDMLRQIEGSAGIQRRGLILATLTKLKQVCNHPAHYLSEPLGGEFGSRSGKVQRLRAMLEEAIAEGDKSLIFTQFTEFGRLLQGYLEQELGTAVLFLHGGTSQPNRERLVERFQYETNGPPIFILSLRAGGTGLNLTAANHVFHVDRWWNPAVENQATDRAFRIGQLRNVQVHKFVCLGTLEDRIDQMIESKKDLAEQVVGAGESWLTELSTGELREVFSLKREAIEDE